MPSDILLPVVPVLAGAEKLNAEPAVVVVVPNPPNPPNLKRINETERKNLLHT